MGLCYTQLREVRQEKRESVGQEGREGGIETDREGRRESERTRCMSMHNCADHWRKGGREGERESTVCPCLATASRSRRGGREGRQDGGQVKLRALILGAGCHCMS